MLLPSLSLKVQGGWFNLKGVFILLLRITVVPALLILGGDVVYHARDCRPIEIPRGYLAKSLTSLCGHSVKHSGLRSTKIQHPKNIWRSRFLHRLCDGVHLAETNFIVASCARPACNKTVKRLRYVAPPWTSMPASELLLCNVGVRLRAVIILVVVLSRW